MAPQLHWPGKQHHHASHLPPGPKQRMADVYTDITVEWTSLEKADQTSPFKMEPIQSL